VVIAGLGQAVEPLTPGVDGLRYGLAVAWMYDKTRGRT
jgi:hypothetical protein